MIKTRNISKLHLSRRFWDISHELKNIVGCSYILVIRITKHYAKLLAITSHAGNTYKLENKNPN